MHELLPPVAPEEAFEMFVDPARLVRWIGLSADLDPRLAGWIRFLDRLRATAMGSAPAPYPTEDPEERRQWLSTS